MELSEILYALGIKGQRVVVDMRLNEVVAITILGINSMELTSFRTRLHGKYQMRLISGHISNLVVVCI